MKNKIDNEAGSEKKKSKAGSPVTAKVKKLFIIVISKETSQKESPKECQRKPCYIRNLL